MYILQFGFVRKQLDEFEDQFGFWDEDDVILYFIIFFDDVNLGVVKDNFVVDNILSDCKS